jgi:hypothetical protein
MSWAFMLCQALCLKELTVEVAGGQGQTSTVLNTMLIRLPWQTHYHFPSASIGF